MPTKLSRWGNSAGLRVPRHVLECAGLQIPQFAYLEDSSAQYRSPVPETKTNQGQIQGTQF